MAAGMCVYVSCPGQDTEAVEVPCDATVADIRAGLPESLRDAALTFGGGAPLLDCELLSDIGLSAEAMLQAHFSTGLSWDPACCPPTIRLSSAVEGGPLTCASLDEEKVEETGAESFIPHVVTCAKYATGTHSWSIRVSATEASSGSVSSVYVGIFPDAFCHRDVLVDRPKPGRLVYCGNNGAIGQDGKYGSGGELPACSATGLELALTLDCEQQELTIASRGRSASRKCGQPPPYRPCVGIWTRNVTVEICAAPDAAPG
eukprot:TRINITY_DN39527_c0_g1_i1.p1 TRINITY_DN39527_c0_g1~~TRINITY_DN39527_c0_g1_i1.p1  ORF type:complete len:286 (+),score=32.92 TRINITY_DN39527_c0_g1_i1:81-860(+)